MCVWLILTAVALMCLSGVPGCLMSRHTSTGQHIAACLMVTGGAVGLWGVATAFAQAEPPALSADWWLPWGRFAVVVDPVSALFLGPVFLVPALATIYGLEYWRQSEHADNGRWLSAFIGLMSGAIAMVVVARDAVLFLMAWEVMAVAAYFALVTEQDKPEVRRVGWVYFIATHMGTLCLFALFALWRHATGSFALVPAHGMSQELAGPIFVLALVGFSFKAGVFPLHFWLPGAHANAPSHLSALMSGVLLKTGVYGLVRMLSILPVPPMWWGAALLVAGTVTGILGIAFALSQRDFKRLLAYSSVENIGIIVMGLGLAALGRATGQMAWIVLGLGGALLHVWNHSLFKSLLFLNAGAILHTTHTREIDQLGGLGKRMPISMLLFAIGAVAICGLPPLNGFVSEWLLYLGLLGTLGETGSPGMPAAATAAVALALIGALAVICFVKLLGAVFLGSPRSDLTAHAHDPGPNMLAPMAVLATLCMGIGLFPILLAPLVDIAVKGWVGVETPGAPATPMLSGVTPLGWISALGLGLLALAAMIALLLKRLARAAVVGKAGTWDCGYAQPTPRMQYTGSSLTQMIVDLLGWIVWPRRLRTAIRGLFARASRFKTDTPDLVLDRGLLPVVAGFLGLLPWVRRLQQGQVHAYLLYVLLIVVFLFWLGT